MLILIVLTAIVWLYFIWTRRHLYTLSWQMNGPPALPILGNALSMWNEEKNVLFLDELAQKYESPVRVWMGPNLYIFIHDAVSAETVLRSKVCLDKPVIYNAIRETLGGDGLFTSCGEHWRYHRKLLQPSLKDSAISSHFSIFNYYLREFCSIQLANEANNGKPFDLYLPTNVCLLSMFLEATFGQEWTHKSEYCNSFQESIPEVAKRFFRPWLEFKWIRKFTDYDKKVGHFQKLSDVVVNGIIQRSIDESSSSESFVDKLVGISKENPDFTINDIKVESHSLLIGASDTAGLSLSTAVLMMAIHTDCQQRMFDELITVMPNKDMDLTTDMLSKLPFMDACIRESLRLFPTVPLIGRSPAEPIVLNNTEIPPGVTVILGIRQIQRQQEYWGEDAHLYKPERFLGDNASYKEIPGCYIPFSSGPRNCIGYSHALYAMKLGLAHIIRNYHVTSPLKFSELEIRYTMSFRMVNKTMVQLHRRTE